MKRTAVLNVVGLSQSLLGEATPRLTAFARAGGASTIVPAFPAVTCTAQSNYLTGRLPSDHGVVANGWYDRSLAEVHFWKQSNHLVQASKLWDELRAHDPKFTCANLFWWFNMYSGVDYSITPRPMYPADGRKFFDIYAWPFSIRPEIKAELGEFPFPAFWGPAAGAHSARFSADAVSRWIAQAARWIEQKYSPTLSLVYLPHLDYNLQRWGPGATELREDFALIDGMVGDLIDFFQSRSVQVVLLSEYGIGPVENPVHLNRLFREEGWLTIKEELGLELLDPGASKAFAVADHQVAHVYLNDRSIEARVRDLLGRTAGVQAVLGEKEKALVGLQHRRAGDFVVEATENAWFTYYYWTDDERAPDFARTVDIHRKPGYDPVELFLDPDQKLVRLKILWRLLQKKLGFRMLMDVIPLNASLVRGSHGRRPTSASEQPVLVAEDRSLFSNSQLDSTEICRFIRQAVLRP